MDACLTDLKWRFCASNSSVSYVPNRGVLMAQGGSGGVYFPSKPGVSIPPRAHKFARGGEKPSFYDTGFDPNNNQKFAPSAGYGPQTR